MKLARSCQELLQQAELRIARLQESFAGGSALREEPQPYASEAALDVETPASASE
jgi:hypothetical protein